MCCSVTSHCEGKISESPDGCGELRLHNLWCLFFETDLQRQLQQSREAADHFHDLLQEKEAALNKLKQDFYEQEQEKNKQQEDYMSMFNSMMVLV